MNNPMKAPNKTALILSSIIKYGREMGSVGANYIPSPSAFSNSGGG